jgi:hypothetical protein
VREYFSANKGYKSCFYDSFLVLWSDEICTFPIDCAFCHVAPFTEYVGWSLTHYPRMSDFSRKVLN